MLTPFKSFCFILISIAVMCGPSVSWAGPAVQGAHSRGRGFPSFGPWVSCYGSASNFGGLERAAKTFRILNIDADPGVGGFTRTQIDLLKAGGRNRVISYMNVGAMESFRTYWTQVPKGFVAGKKNTLAHLGTYSGYPDETWMDLSSRSYQNLIVNYVAVRLAKQGVDGFFLDNLELIEHSSTDSNGPCSAACRQGGLDLVRRLREKFPKMLIVMQNCTSDITRLGKTGGVAFPSLLDGISHEEVYTPERDPNTESELRAWRDMHLRPDGRAFWIGTEDYVGSCTNVKAARRVYKESRAQHFSPYVTDASASQQKICYWKF